jgi:hypothetical protein
VNHKKGYLTAEQAMRSKAAQVPGATIEEDCRICRLVHVNPPAPAPDPNRNSGPSDAVRALVLARDGYACVCCGTSIIGQRYSLGHRLRASHGGKPVPSNLVTLAGLGGELCHGRIDFRRDPADEAKGYSLRSYQNPLLVPVTIARPDGPGLPLWLDDLGRYLPEAPEGAEAA